MNEPQLECFDCMAAASGVHHGFSSGCRGCAARAASRSPPYAVARKTGRQDWRYRAMLELLGVSHDEVKAAAAIDDVHKEPAA